ncbi:MAG: hypothetical protein JWN07_2141, partial [Hyphomicrobiales bacterium]|nr:hypothetical protein [Hyphomicrobiales bacterium]
MPFSLLLHNRFLPLTISALVGVASMI